MTEIVLEANECWIDTTPANLTKNCGDFGIYILGIKSNHEDGRILPYYVGISRGSLSARVKKHISDINKPKTTYSIFSEDFLRSKRGTSSDFIQRIELPSIQYPASEYGGDILYLNEEYFFYHSAIADEFIPVFKKDCPLDTLNFAKLRRAKTMKSIYDSARSVQRNVLNNTNCLYFTTITFSRDIFQGVFTVPYILEYIETFIKFSLKINTIGKSFPYSKLHEFLQNNSISLKIKYPILKEEFHNQTNCPTPKSTVLFS